MGTTFGWREWCSIRLGEAVKSEGFNTIGMLRMQPDAAGTADAGRDTVVVVSVGDRPLSEVAAAMVRSGTRGSPSGGEFARRGQDEGADLVEVALA